MKVLLFVALFIFTIDSFGQVIQEDSISYDSIWYNSDFNDSNYYYQNVKSPFFDSEYFGLNGYFFLSGEIYSVNHTFFKELINNPESPYVELQDVSTMLWIGLSRNNLFSSFSFAPTFSKFKKIDSLKIESKLNQNSLAFRFGYNLIKNKTLIISPYLGLRASRFRHLTRSQNKKTLIDDYLLNPNIDLRVTQYSSTLGLNFTVCANGWSFGGYFELLVDFNDHPLIRTKGSKLTSQISNPMNNYVIGLGMGYGFINDKRQMHNKR